MILRFTSGSSFEDFSSNEMLREAVMRKLEIIGEATKRVSPELRKLHPEIPWKEMAGMRDKIIHNYMGVNVLTIWNAVRENIPDLEPKLQKLLNGN